MKLLAAIPWALVVFCLAILAHVFKMPLEISGVIGLSFLIAYFVAFGVEFAKSSSTSVDDFIMDLVFSVLTLIIATAFMSYQLCKGHTFYVVDAVGILVILFDSIISPWNAFKASKKDISMHGL